MVAVVSVVSTNCESGPDEILKNGEYGTLVPVGDDQALANALLTVLSEPNKPVEPTWLEQFTLTTATQRYLQTLKLL